VVGYRDSDLLTNNRKSSALSPDKEDRYYATRGSLGLDDNSKILVDTVKEEKVVWPRLFITLSNKEKEEDFMAMKGCKPSQRPKKRAKLIQRTLLVSLLNTYTKKGIWGLLKIREVFSFSFDGSLC
jgi:hypothetical protein